MSAVAPRPDKRGYGWDDREGREETPAPPQPPRRRQQRYSATWSARAINVVATRRHCFIRLKNLMAQIPDAVGIPAEADRLAAIASGSDVDPNMPYQRACGSLFIRKRTRYAHFEFFRYDISDIAGTTRVLL